MRRFLPAALVLTLALLPAPAGADHDELHGTGGRSELSVATVEVRGTAIRVAGSIEMTTWNTWRVYFPYDEDPVGDTLGGAIHGWEIIEGLFESNDHRSFIFILNKTDVGGWGVRGPVAFSWPVSVDGRDEGTWLGAGRTGTGVPPTVLGGWAGICTSTVQPCEPLEGGIGDGAAGWVVSHERLGADLGSMIEVGSANGGAPASFVWPAAPAADGTGALSAADDVPSFKLQGEVRVGIAPTGTPADQVEYPARATVDLRPGDAGFGDWSGEISRPVAPGTYDVHVRTCWGLVDSLDCDHDVSQISI